MSKLKIQKKQVIDSFDFDDLVQETYGRHYCFQQQENCKPRGMYYFTVPETYTADDEMHDSIPEVINGRKKGVKFKVWLERDPKKPIEDGRCDESTLNMFWGRNFYPDFGTVVNDLHSKGLIEAGEYCLEIDW